MANNSVHFEQPEPPPLKVSIMCATMSWHFALMSPKCLEFGWNLATLDEKITRYTGNSLKGQTPLQLAELSGKHSLSITAEETWDDSPEAEISAIQ